jgi:hypothetical protein
MHPLVRSPTLRLSANARLWKGQQVHGAGLCVGLNGDYFGWTGSLSLGRLPCSMLMLSPGLVLGLDEQKNMYYPLIRQQNSRPNRQCFRAALACTGVQ